MQAAVLHGGKQPLAIEDVDLAAPRAGEVRVRVMATGLCHSDLHFLDGLRDGPYPIIMGHEGAGIVEAVGPGVAEVAVGDHAGRSQVPHDAVGDVSRPLRGAAGEQDHVALGDPPPQDDGGTSAHHFIFFALSPAHWEEACRSPGAPRS